MTDYTKPSFSVSGRGRDPSICHHRGAHAEPDLRGNCFMCGEPITLAAPILPDGAPTAAQVRALIAAVEGGALPIVSRDSASEIGWGDMTYDAADGSVLVVFIDGYEFDYIESITLAGFPALDYDHLTHLCPELNSHRPSDDVERTIYGIA